MGLRENLKVMVVLRLFHPELGLVRLLALVLLTNSLQFLLLYLKKRLWMQLYYQSLFLLSSKRAVFRPRHCEVASLMQFFFSPFGGRFWAAKFCPQARL